MSETKPITNVEEITVDDLDTLLAIPGAEAIMVPGEQNANEEEIKPTFFSKGKVDMNFLDPDAEEPEIPAVESFNEIVAEVLDEEEEEEIITTPKSKPGREKLDKTGMSQLAKTLIDDGIILPFADDDKSLDEYTLDDYKELFKMNIEERENKVKESTPKEFFEALPKELQAAAKYVADGGQDLKGLFKHLAAVEENKSISLDTEKGQELVARQFLQATNFGTEDEIQEQIESWKDLDKLEAKASQFKPRLDAMQDQIIQRQLEIQENSRRKREQAQAQYADNVYDTLAKGELNGAKLNSKVQNMIYQGLTQPNYKSMAGNPTNLLGHLLEKHQYIEPNHELIAEALWLLADPEGYKGEMSKKITTKATVETVRQLKTEQANKNTSSAQEEDLSRKQVRQGIKRQPQGSFFRKANN